VLCASNIHYCRFQTCVTLLKVDFQMQTYNLFKFEGFGYSLSEFCDLDAIQPLTAFRNQR